MQGEADTKTLYILKSMFYGEDGECPQLPRTSCSKGTLREDSKFETPSGEPWWKIKGAFLTINGLGVGNNDWHSAKAQSLLPELPPVKQHPEHSSFKVFLKPI